MRESSSARLAELSLWCVAIVSASLAGVLLGRRAAGAMGQALSAEGLVVLALAQTLLLGIARLTYRRVGWPGAALGGKWSVAFELLLTLAAIGMGVALSLPGSSSGALLSFWGIVMAGEAGGWITRFRARAGRYRGEPSPGQPAVPDRAAFPQDPSSGECPPVDGTATEQEEAGDEEGTELLPVGVSQRMIRSQVEGSTFIHGTVRCDFASGQRQQNMHLAFCPPLTKRPHLHLEQVAGPIAKLDASLVEVFGACFEVKLPTPSNEPAGVQIHFCVSEAPVDRESA